VRIRSAIALNGAPLDGASPEGRAAFDAALPKLPHLLDCRPDRGRPTKLGNLIWTPACGPRDPAFEDAVKLAPSS
jgi:hypothetical protein